jgi:hypothetical protein
MKKSNSKGSVTVLFPVTGISFCTYCTTTTAAGRKAEVTELKACCKQTAGQSVTSTVKYFYIKVGCAVLCLDLYQV